MLFTLLLFCVGLKDVRNTSKFGWTAHYRCVSYRSSVNGKRCGCKAWIRIRHSDGCVIVSDDDHFSCAEALKRARVSDSWIVRSSVYDRVAKRREPAS